MAPLVIPVLAHAVLGIALAVVVWLAGIGLGGGDKQRVGEAYAAGLLLVSAGSFLVLLTPLFAPLVAAGAAAAAWIGARRATADVLVPATRALAAASPGAVGFAVALGLFQHGPDAERGSNAFGDLVFYVAQLVSAARSIVPFHDLSLAAHEHTYLQAAPVVLGGAVEPLPGFDPFLFFAATLPAFAFAALAFGIGASGGASRHVAVPAALAAGAVAYPTWLSESPPVALAAPVAFGICSFLAAPSARSVALSTLALAATKVVGILPLGAAVAAAAAPRVARGDLRDRLAAAAAVVGLGAVAIVVLLSAHWLTELVTLDFLPADAVEGLNEQRATRSTRALAPALLVVGHALLVAGAVRLRHPAIVAAASAGVAATWLIGGHTADVAFLLPALLVALELRRGADRTTTAVLAAAAAFLLTAAWFRETAGLGTGLALLVLALLALAGAFSGTGSSARVALFGAVSAAVVCAAALGGALRLDDEAQPLTRDEFAAWNRLRVAAPADALVFTSLTGRQIETDAGWNYVGAALGRRQIYVAGWANSELRVRPAERARRLLLNRLALAGDLRPALVDAEVDAETPLFALIRSDETAPPQGIRLYDNRRLALYELRRP